VVGAEPLRAEHGVDEVVIIMVSNTVFVKAVHAWIFPICRCTPSKRQKKSRGD
jgi:hypothetical protein